MLEVLRSPGPLMGTFDLGADLPQLDQDPGVPFTEPSLPLGEVSTPASIKRDMSAVRPLLG